MKKLLVMGVFSFLLGCASQTIANNTVEPIWSIPEGGPRVYTFIHKPEGFTYTKACYVAIYSATVSISCVGS